MVKLMAVGDVCLGEHPLCNGFGVASSLRRFGAANFFADVGELFGSADIVFGNFEGVVVGGGGESKAVLPFGGAAEILVDLQGMGFTCLNVANNHTCQYGESGFHQMVSEIANLGIGVIGLESRENLSATEPVKLERRGITFGFLGYSFVPDPLHPGRGVYASPTYDQVRGDVSLLSGLVDHVIVSCHWGVELAKVPHEGVVAAARGLVDSGASLVLGHHPHVWQGVERRGRGVIFYSLGDFVFDLMWCKEARRSAIVEVSFDHESVKSWALHPVYSDNRHRPRRMVGDTASEFISEIRDLSSMIPLEVLAEPLSKPGPEYLASLREAQRRNQINKIRHVLQNSLRLGPRRVMGIARRVLSGSQPSNNN